MTTADFEEHGPGMSAPRMRRHILRLLLDATAPLDAAGIAATTGLHVSTVRFHLEQLEEAGLARREAEHSGARGRPRMLYVAGPAARAEETQRALTATLAAALAQDEDGGRSRAVAAGRDWASVLPVGVSGDDGAAVVDTLGRLGFDPEREPEDEIALHACPLRPLAAGHPEVVCGVHLGLLQGTVERLGHRREDVELLPFAEPELCRVRLGGTFAERDRTGVETP